MEDLPLSSSPRVVIQEFRCIERLDLSLEAGTSLLVGENNSGKSSVLQALAIALGKRRASTDDLRRTASGCTLKSRGGVMDGEYIVMDGWPLQFLPPTGPLVEAALARASTVDVEGVPARVFSAEHLAAIALETGRGKVALRVVS